MHAAVSCADSRQVGMNASSCCNLISIRVSMHVIFWKLCNLATFSAYKQWLKVCIVVYRLIVSAIIRDRGICGYNTSTWLILPVVICLSQRLSHACLSINFYTRGCAFASQLAQISIILVPLFSAQCEHSHSTKFVIVFSDGQIVL